MNDVMPTAELRDYLGKLLENSDQIASVESYPVPEDNGGGLTDLRVTCADGTVFELRTVGASPVGRSG